jgi:hypothetical protein
MGGRERDEDVLLLGTKFRVLKFRVPVEGGKNHPSVASLL